MFNFAQISWVYEAVTEADLSRQVREIKHKFPPLLKHVLHEHKLTLH